jgi:hypothetical protein
MPKFKQGMAAVTLVATLGLVAPSTFGGWASADIPVNPGGHPDNPNNVTSTFYCDVDGQGTGEAQYETKYDLVSTGSSTMWQDQKSNTILVQRLKIDVKDSHYVVVQDPTGDAVPFDDPDTYWFDGPKTYPNGKPKGWQTVRCTEIVEYGYSPFPDESTPEFNEKYGLSFVQTDECEVFGDLEDPSEVDDCVTYLVTETNLYDVTIGGSGKGQTKAAGAKSAAHGKHRHKRGKHRR